MSEQKETPREFWIVESATGSTREACTREDLAESLRIVNDERYSSLAPWKVIPCREIAFEDSRGFWALVGRDGVAFCVVMSDDIAKACKIVRSFNELFPGLAPWEAVPCQKIAQ